MAKPIPDQEVKRLAVDLPKENLSYLVKKQPSLMR